MYKSDRMLCLGWVDGWTRPCFAAGSRRRFCNIGCKCRARPLAAAGWTAELDRKISPMVAVGVTTRRVQLRPMMSPRDGVVAIWVASLTAELRTSPRVPCESKLRLGRVRSSRSPWDAESVRNGAQRTSGSPKDRMNRD